MTEDGLSLNDVDVDEMADGRQMETISELGRRVRDYINEPRKHLAIFGDEAEYHKLCSCLDVIGDTELAFDSYDELPDLNDSGSNYIFVYGFLQGLFLQQDAIRNLFEALQLPYVPDALLLEVRELRNDAIGHPTKRGGGKGRSFSFISRPSLSKTGFQLMTAVPGAGLPTFRYVDLYSLRDTQGTQVRAALEALLQSLRKEEMEHRQEFRENRS